MSQPAKQINVSSLQIVNGKYDAAIGSLTRTLNTLKLVLSGAYKMEDENEDCMMDKSHLSASLSDNFECDFIRSPSSSSFLKTIIIVDECNIDNKSNRSAIGPQHHLQISIYRDPIVVKGKNFAASLDLRICDELCYVVLYNLALAHHLRSVELAKDPSKQKLRYVYLCKAHSLYKHSYQLLMEQTVNIYSGALVIHSMALLSNISQIHHTFGNHGKAELCMQQLLSTIMYVVNCGNADTLGNSMEEFFIMLLPLISGDLPAPAA